MSETGPTENPLQKIIDVFMTLDLLAIGAQGVDVSRKIVEGLINTAENFAVTMDNLNRTTTRINEFLDEIEEPMKRLLSQAGPALNAAATMAEAANAMGDLAKKMSPLTALADNASGLLNIFGGNRPSDNAKS